MVDRSNLPTRVLKHNDKVQIVYFSGTGGTAQVSSNFEKMFAENMIEVVMVPLNMQENGYQQAPAIEKTVGLLLIIYPVHAFDAPGPVYDWIGKANAEKGLPCALISVSGGGEVWPNTACRAGCIEILESKGINVFYERMLIMPSNIFIATEEQLASWLLMIMPLKVEHCVNEILSGIRRRTGKPFASKLIAAFSELEKRESYKFGRDLTVHSSCTGCGWCVSNCPKRNITLSNGRPSFGGECIICLSCIYGCPFKAINSQHYGWLLIKEGYNLCDHKEKINGIEILPLHKVKYGLLYIGVKKYLNNIIY